jgi:hypothetical protein
VSDKEVLMTSRVDNYGPWYFPEQLDTRRGDVIRVPNKQEARRIHAAGLADYGRVPPDKLRPAYEQNAEQIAEGQKLAAEAKEKYYRDMPELAPIPGSGPVHTRPVAWQGWRV